MRPSGEEQPIRLPAGAYFGRTASTFSAPTFQLSESQYEDRQHLPLHSHENAHFCFVVHGTYTEQIDGHRVERRSRDLMFYPAGQPHAERHHDLNRHFLIELTPKIVAIGASACIPLDSVRDLRSAATRVMAGRLYRESSYPDAISGLAAEALLLELLALSGRDVKIRRAGGAAWLRRVEEVLRERFAEPIGLGEAAAVAGVHPVHLARVFRREYGCSIGEFVRRVRIDAAREELVGGEASIAEIASRVGFADQSHLHRTFKRATGMTPDQFRRSRR
ncbi:MAG TPA: AraC family transcriptional regulator [Thermoanaerobaculia bacterium]|nr:AraC family transcriptional regulator [Thermoanaerobaculia bacterium]